MMKHSRIVLAIIVGCAVAVIPPLFQPHLKAGSFLDFACEVFLLPGQLIPSLFHDRGTASPSSFSLKSSAFVASRSQFIVVGLLILLAVVGSFTIRFGADTGS